MQPRARHLEHAELVRGPEPVLHRTQDAVRVIAISFELQNAVDEVLEDSRPRDGSILRHVSDENRRDARFFCGAQQSCSRLAHLSDGSRRRSDLGGIQRLHRIDHADVRALRLERRDHRLELRLREDLDALCTAEPFGAKLHLRCRFLAGHEECTPVLRDRRERRQQERRLPDAGLTADEHERGRHEAAAEDAIELGDPGRDPLRRLGIDVDEAQERLRRHFCAICGGQDVLDERPI